MKNRITDDKMRVFLNARDFSLLFSSSIKSQGRELPCTETIKLLWRDLYFSNPKVFIVYRVRREAK